MPLTSTISLYNPEWPQRFEEEVNRIAPIFGSNVVEIHHVGSTAVVGLAAKPEIDILIVVADQSSSDIWTERFSKIGYVRGRDLSMGHLFYRRNVGGARTHKVHVCIEGHEKISEMLTFRYLLRSNPGIRERYQELKFKLEAENTEGIGQYLDGKAPFIRDALQRIRASAT